MPKLTAETAFPLDVGYNYAAALRWLHEDGREGTEVAHIPPLGRVFFFDGNGAVLRLDDVREARWLVKKTQYMRAAGRQVEVRITRLVGTHHEHKGDGYFFVIPNPTQPIVIHCTRDKAHDGCQPDTCLLLEGAVKQWIEEPIIAALKRG
jgi:hypothetical protein